MQNLTPGDQSPSLNSVTPLGGGRGGGGRGEGVGGGGGLELGLGLRG